jgi:hypothetical protein
MRLSPFLERQMVHVQDLSPAKPAPQGLACDCFGRPQTPRERCCLALPDERVKRPDLAIYSQQEVIAKAGEPTWNSPDIITVDFPYTRLNAETRVTVRNLSPDTWAVAAQVHFFISPFGIGFERRHVGSQTVTLPPSASADLLFPLSPTIASGDPRTGVHIEIQHPHDPNPINDSGSQVLAAALTSVAGRSLALTIPVRNRAAVARRISFRVVAGDLRAVVEPTSLTLAASEEGTVVLRSEVPASLRPTPDHGTRRSVTVIATAEDGSLVGGVTQHIVVDA